MEWMPNSTCNHRYVVSNIYDAITCHQQVIGALVFWFGWRKLSGNVNKKGQSKHYGPVVSTY